MEVCGVACGLECLGELSGLEELALVVSRVVVTVWQAPLLHSSKLTVRAGTGFVTGNSKLVPAVSAGSELVHQYNRAPSV